MSDSLINPTDATSLFAMIFVLFIVIFVIIAPLIITALLHIFYLRKKIENPKGLWVVTIGVCLLLYLIIIISLFVWGRF